ENAEEEIADLIQQPHDRMGEPREHDHRYGNQFRYPLCTKQADTLWNQFTENDGEKGDQYYDQCCCNGAGIRLQAIYLFDRRFELFTESLARVHTRQDGNQCDAYLRS